LSSILKKQHLQASFISGIVKFQKLTGLLEIGNNFTAKWATPGRLLTAFCLVT